VLHVGHDRQSEGCRVLAPIGVLHSFAALTGNALDLSERDRILMILPMFTRKRGASLLRVPVWSVTRDPGRYLQAEPLTRMVKEDASRFGRGADIWPHLSYGEQHASTCRVSA